MPYPAEAQDVLHDAQAFWLRAPGHGEIRPVALPEPGPGDVVVRTLRSGVSRGTETLVFRGGVPRSQHAAMRAPFQEGDFPGPVKYGYLNVGAVEQGPPELRGRTVFCLYPHQTAYVVPVGAVTVVPDDMPPARAHGLADRHFFHASARADQKKVHEIDRADEQEEKHAGLH